MTTSKAKSFILSICDTDFIFVLVYLSYALKRTLLLSRSLQSPTVDFKNVSEIIQCTIAALQSNSSNCFSDFVNLYLEVK